MAENSSPRYETRWCSAPPPEERPAVGPPPCRRRLLWLGAATLGIVGVLAGVASWFEPEPRVHFMPCWITEYQSPRIPANTAAEGDRVAICAARLWPEGGKVTVAGQTRHRLLEQLAALSLPDVPKTVLLYLSGYAGIDGQNRVFVLPADAEPSDTQSRLLLGEVLQRLRQCPAPHKLIVLDVCWPLADPRLGLLDNDVAARIPDELKEVPDEARLVLMPCSAGQTALVSEDLGRSIFGYYFQQALEGAADGYGAMPERDGRISVVELANMVRARVERWSVSNRCVRQTPRLLGSGQDFDLRSVALGEISAERPLPIALPYPAWLTEGWALRDRWWDDETYRIAPRLFAQLEAMLLRAEEQWSSGGDADRIYRDLQADLDHLSKRRAECEELLRRPPSRSLARLVEAGLTVDPKLAQALDDVLQKTAALITSKQPAAKVASGRDALLAAFQKKMKDCSADQMALAVYREAMIEAHCRPAMLDTLDDILAHWQPRPMYVETLLLRRARELADRMPSDAWSPAITHRALRAAWLGEGAAADTQTITWLLPLLDEAATLRHEGETMFFARGYVPLVTAEGRLREAIVRFEQLNEQQHALREAYRLRDRAMSRLPAYRPYLEYAGDLHPHWVETVEATAALAEELMSPTALTPDKPTAASEVLSRLFYGKSTQATATHEQTTGSEPDSSADLFRRIEAIRQRAALVRTRAEELEQPFQASSLKRLVARSRRSDATGDTYRQIRAVLSTPLPRASQRILLWEAGRRLSRRLHQRVVARDELERRNGTMTAYTDSVESGSPCDQCRRAVRRRAERSVALLKLGGVASADCLRMLRSAMSKASRLSNDGRRGKSVRKQSPGHLPGKQATVDLPKVAASLCEAWNQGLPVAYRRSDDPFVRDRISRLVSPWRPLAQFDLPASNPAVRVQVLELTAHCSWLADYYRYRARDEFAPSFYWEVAGTYLHRIGGLQESYFEILGPEEVPQLDSEHEEAKCEMSWRAVGWGTRQPPVEIAALPPADPRLRVTRSASHGANRNGGQAATFRIIFDASSDVGAEMQPDGFLVQLKAGERSYHRRVTLPTLPKASGLRLLVSDDPHTPEPALEALCLRPNGARRSFYLFVRNDSLQTRSVAVRLSAGGRFESPLEIAPGQTLPVKFKGTPPDPKSPLPEVAGSLEVEVVDASTHEVLTRKQLAIRVLSPREYVQATSIQFVPATAKQPKNRLEIELRGAELPPGGPCFAELDVPIDQIDGLLAVGGGALRGKLPPGGKTLSLHADKLKLANGPVEGDVYLNVDGCPRAFIYRTDFAQQGDPTTPREDLRPDVRIEADRYAKAGPGYQVTIKTDNVPAAARLEVQLGNSEGEDFLSQLSQTLPSGRRIRIGFSPFGAEGALVASGSNGDWQVDLDTTGMIGQRTLRVRMLDAQGNALQTAEEQVVFEGGPPKGSRFVDLPAAAPAGKPLVLKVAAARCPSGIDQVKLVMGKPVDGKLPPGAKLVAAEQETDSDGTWAATLNMPKSTEEAVEVSAQLTSRAGMVEWITTKLSLGSADMADAGSVRGKVLEGPRPQAGLEVLLKDDKGAVKAKTTTGDDGTFGFGGVKPGKYTAASSKPVSGRKGAASVDVAPQQQAEVTVELWL